VNHLRTYFLIWLAAAILIAGSPIGAHASTYDNDRPTYDSNGRLLPVCTDQTYDRLRAEWEVLHHAAIDNDAAVHAAYLKAMELSECGDKRSDVFNAQFKAAHH
jgi:hypothetical protein